MGFCGELVEDGESLHAPKPIPAKHDVDARVMSAAIIHRMFGAAADPVRIDRFVIHECIGRGGGGSVFDAFDTRLQRSVALKLLTDEIAQRSDSSSTTRMLREAQALARLNHPNIVEVYAAGVEAGSVWIAMELVRGTNLRQWALANRADANERLDARARFARALPLLLQAAHGLEAAHAAGLVHRDFKPANVLVGDDGRVRVADFGLARPLGPLDLEPLRGQSSERSSDRASGATATGTVAGTPRYMAPEQFRGELVDARADQFAFAVTAWEVVFGALPYAGDSPFAVVEAIESGVLQPGSDAAPRWFVRALERALASDPAARYPSMTELVAALTPPRRPRALAVVAGGTLIAALAGWTVLTNERTDCSPAAARDEIAAMWNPERRAAITDGLHASGVPYVEATADAVQRGVTDFTDAWAEQHLATCRATSQEHVATERELDERMTCLRGRLRMLDAVLARVEVASAKVAENAVLAIRSIPPPATCIAPELQDADNSGAAKMLRERLAAAEADHSIGDDAAAREHAEAIASEATALGLEVLAGDAFELAGRAPASPSDPRRRESLRAAYDIAVAHADDVRAHRRAYLLAYAASSVLQFRDAHEWLRHAEAIRARHPADALAYAAALQVECNVLGGEGQRALAVEKCSEALDILETADALDTDIAWFTVYNLSLHLTELGRYDDAQTQVAELYRSTRRDFGASHPKTAAIAGLLGRIASLNGDHETAVQWQRECATAMEQAMGPGHPWTALGYTHLGMSLMNGGDLVGAEQALQRALANCHAGCESQRLDSLRSLALVRIRQDRVDDAIAVLQEARALAEVKLREDHFERVGIRGSLGAALLAGGRTVEAERELGDVVEHVRGRVLLDTMAFTYYALFAAVAERDGRFADAIARSRSAVAGCSAAREWRSKCVLGMARLASAHLGAGERAAAETWIAVASALAEPDPKQKGAADRAALRLVRARLLGMDGEREAARALAEQALAEVDPDIDYHSREEQRRLKAWLAEHPL